MAWVCRWDKPDGGKEIRPFTYCESPAGRCEWRAKHLPAPRPLYRLDRIAQSAAAVPLLICEGEKAADAAGLLFPDLLSIASSGGSEAADRTDWSPIVGREVMIWPDNDTPGRRYAERVAGLALAAGARSVRIVAVPTEWPVGWDLADELPDGVALGKLRAMLEAAEPCAPAAPGHEESEGAVSPDMTIVRRVAAPAPEFDLTALGPLADWVKRAAASKGSPIDYVAIGLLGAAAACIGAARWVSPWAGWIEPAILWLMLLGAPSSGKSPGLDAARAALAALEREANADWPDRWRDHLSAETLVKAHGGAWEDATRAAVKAGKTPPPRPPEADAPSSPQMKRIVVSDATIEAVATILSGNPRGLVLWRDEAAGFLGNLGKYGDGDRAFYLESYGGRPYTVDRKKLTEPLVLEHLALSIVAGIQPDRYASLLMAGDDDGMGARFLLAWPDAIPPTRPKHGAELLPIVRAFRRLHSLAVQRDVDGAQGPVVLPLEAAAADILQTWRLDHHAAAVSASGLMASALGKLPGQALRLALVLDLLIWAAGPDDVPEIVEVSGESLTAALDLVDGYFRPMLARVLGEASLPLADRDAAVLAREIIKRKARRINRREVRRDWRLPGLREAKRLAAAISVLEEARWLVPDGGRDGGSPGRERADYAVDPRVHEVST